MSDIKKLSEIRSFCGPKQTVGLSDSNIQKFYAKDPSLVSAIDQGFVVFEELKQQNASLLKKSEEDLIRDLQEGFLNFYKENSVNPFVAIAGEGPWIITSHGAVIHDSGGYGMLGLGQNRKAIGEALCGKYVMANIMSPSFSQKKFIDALHKEIGQKWRNHHDGAPYGKFLCLNSGSEAMTMAGRLSDLNAKTQTDDKGAWRGAKIKFLVLSGSFHGRTERPAQASHSSREAYQNLASFQKLDNLIIVEPNNVKQLQEAFARAKAENIFIELMFMEPVMGEGNPGFAISPEFYREARKLTRENGSFLLVDSIQAGLRTTGYLSIVDYPGFETLDPPDMESYSKAINGGQYPLSILAMSDAVAGIYKKGVYGNTMTTNPRALEIAVTVLNEMTPKIRENIRNKGQEFLSLFHKLKEEFPSAIEGAQGTGLLCSLKLSENGYKVLGDVCVEKELRKAGIGVIHGGKNALRFTPHFAITSEEIQLIGEEIRSVLKKGPIYRG